MRVSILEYSWCAVCAFYVSCIAHVLDKKLRVFLKMFGVPCENTSGDCKLGRELYRTIFSLRNHQYSSRGNRVPSLDEGASSGNEGNIPRWLVQSAEGLDGTSRSSETGVLGSRLRQCLVLSPLPIRYSMSGNWVKLLQTLRVHQGPLRILMSLLERRSLQFPPN